MFIPLVFSCTNEPLANYNLTVNINPEDGGFVNPDGGIVPEGQQISLTATPADEFIFDSWSGAATGTSTNVSVIMDANKTVTANFIKKKYTLTVNVEGEGTVAEKVIKAGAATDYNSGTIVELIATPSEEWLFVEWKGDLTGTENPKEITIDKAKTVTALFVKKQYPLTIEVEGEGTVAEKVIKQGVATDYNSGTIVELTAVPENGWEFVEWKGDLTNNENPTQITIDKAKTVKAKFEEILNYKTELHLSFTEGEGLNQISKSLNGLYVGHDDELIVSDYANYRIMKYTGSNSTGIQLDVPWGTYTNGVMLGDYYGILDEGKGVYAYLNSYDLLFPTEVGAGDADLTKLDGPQGMDYLGVANNTEHNGIYVADTFNHRILFFKWGEKTGKIVAGGNGKGGELNQLYYPTYVEVDIDGTMYLRDHGNNRILKWKVGENVGEVFLNSTDTPIHNGYDIAMDENFIYVLGTYYKDSSGNNVDDGAVYRISKNEPSEFDLIAGGNGIGNGINQFGKNIMFIDIDNEGNLFVADHQNFRVMKISKE